MNWEAMGAAAELLAAMGVIVSLVYLAKQISTTNESVRQNTNALLNQGEHASISGVIDIVAPQVADPSLAELMMSGHSDIEALNPVDKYRYSMALLLMFELHQTYFIQLSRGTAGSETWEYYSRVFDGLMRLPGVVSWWRGVHRNFEPGFTSYINKKISKEA
ncbi:MAG: hypothetical protein ACR2PZ_00255 [Pseudomonadales bacterium]